MIEIGDFCAKSSGILQFLGYVLLVFKIAIPLLIIFYGVFDFGKAVTSGKDDEIKKSAKTLMLRAVAGVIIFFVPSIVMWLFGAVAQYRDADSNVNFGNCRTCVLAPWNCDTSGAENSENGY